METINSMKKRLKGMLNEGTHVSPEVYTKLVQVSEGYIDQLVATTVICFNKDEKASRLNENHVFEAYFIMSGLIKSEEEA